jgi:small conductance mechanosensitive channel
MPADSEPVLVSKEEITNASQSAVTGVWDGFFHLLQGNVPDLTAFAEKQLVPAIFGVVILIAAYFAAKFLARVCSIPIQARVDETLGKFFSKLIFYAIMVAAIVGVIDKLGFNVTSFAAVLAAAGFAVGLAFQGTLSNFAAGVLLLVFRPFKVGDTVVVAGNRGKVFEIDLFSTSMDTADNRRIILPNSSIAGNTIENMTHHAYRRIEVPVAVAYECDLLATRTALDEAAETLGEMLIPGDDYGYKVATESIGLNCVNWNVQAWVKTADCGLARELLIVAIKESLDAHGLKIPSSQMQVHWQTPAVLPMETQTLRPGIESAAANESAFVPRRRAN